MDENVTLLNKTIIYLNETSNGTIHGVPTPYPFFGQTCLDLRDLYFPIHGYLSIIICVFGTIANLLNIIVLTRKEMLSPTNYILTALAISDMLVMADYVPFAFHTYIRSGQPLVDQLSYGWTIFTLFHAHFSVVGHTISTWLTVSLAIFRYLAVKFPTESRNWCTMSSSRYTILFTYIVVPITCLPVYMSFTILKEIDPQSEMFIYRVDWSEIAVRHNELLKKINFWVFSVGTKIVPCILLTFLSKALISALLEAEKRKRRLKQSCYTLAVSSPTDTETETNLQSTATKRLTPVSSGTSQGDRTTRMLLAVLLLFLVTEFPTGFLVLVSGILGESFFAGVYAPLGELLDVLALTNSAVNFVLYCSMSKQFRQTFAKLFFLYK